jgi:hypothetical protein
LGNVAPEAFRVASRFDGAEVSPPPVVSEPAVVSPPEVAAEVVSAAESSLPHAEAISTRDRVPATARRRIEVFTWGCSLVGG